MLLEDLINEMTGSGAIAGVNMTLSGGLLRRPGAKTAVETTPEDVNKKLNKKANKKTKKKIKKS
jgi:hypothetical protein